MLLWCCRAVANGNSMARLASIFDVRCDRGLRCQRHALAMQVARGVDDALWLFYAEDVLAFLMRSCRRGWSSSFVSLRALLRPAVPCIRLATCQRWGAELADAGQGKELRRGIHLI